MIPAQRRHRRGIELLAQAGSANAAVDAVKVERAVPSYAGPTQHIEVGATLDLNAYPVDKANNRIAGVAGTWASDDTNVATVDSSGLVTAVAPGTANITFTQTAAPNKVGTFVVTVGDMVPASVAVTPTTASLDHLVPETQQMTATVKNAANQTIIGATGTWTSSDPTKATVNGSGLVTSVAAGTTDINFVTTVGGISDPTPAVITVT